MFCKNCGNRIAENAKFCSKCGTPVANVVTNQVNQVSQPIAGEKKDTAGLLSFIFGVSSMFLMFIFSVLIFPLAIAGLILGIVSKKKGWKKTLGIILNILAMVISSIILIAVFVFGMVNISEIIEDYEGEYSEIIEDYGINGSKTSNPISGEYSCTEVVNGDEYLISITLNKDLTFLYGPYGDLENNYAAGFYTYDDESKTNYSGDYKYYMVQMRADAENFVVDGVPSNEGFTSKMEFGVTESLGKRSGVAYFPSSGNIYYCYSDN